MSEPRSLLLPIFCLVCLGIVYGSLFPFRFVTELDALAFTRFGASWRNINSIGDILGNLVLFFPYGYLACLLAERARRPLRAAITLQASGGLLALFCQLAQMFTPGRDASLVDWSVDVTGMALGWLVGLRLPLGTSAAKRGRRSEHHLPLVLVLFWLASQLLPGVPSIDLQAWKDAVKPLFALQRWYWQGALLATLCWLVCFHLLEHRAGWRLSPVALCVAAVCIFLARIVIVENRLEPVAVSGLMCAILLWPSAARHWRGEYLAAALFVAYLLDVVAPFVSRGSPQGFGWMPFAGYLQGSMLINAVALCRKLFVFGAVVLLFLGDKPRRMIWAAGLAACLLLLEVAQRYVGRGTPALTDPILFLLLAWLITGRSGVARR